LVLFLLIGGTSVYYFKNDLVNLPIIKDLFVKRNVTILQDVLSQTNNTTAGTQKGQLNVQNLINKNKQSNNTTSVTKNKKLSLKIYNDPNGLYSFSYPEEAKIEYGGRYPMVSMTIPQLDNYSMVLITTDINDNWFNSLLLTDKNNYKKISFGNISTYPTYKYTSVSKGSQDVYGTSYVIDLGSYNNTRLSIIFSVIAGTNSQTGINQIEKIVKSFIINKNNIASVKKILLIKLSESQNYSKDITIRQKLKNIIPNAEVYYNILNSYAGFCKSTEYTNAVKNITKANCKDNSSTYAVIAPISSGYWCIDASGYNDKVSFSVGTSCVK